MKSAFLYNPIRLAYLVVVLLACYFLVFLPFCYSYFNSSYVIYSSSKEFCQIIQDERLPLSQFVQSVALTFNSHMNRKIPDTTKTVLYMEPKCKETVEKPS